MSKGNLFSGLKLRNLFRFLGSRTLTGWMYLARSLFIVEALILLVLCACIHSFYQTATPSQKVTSKQELTLADVRIVKHGMGETKVPIAPKRVIVLDGFSTEVVLALGIKPVGAPQQINYPLSQKQRAGIANVGGGWQTPNLEKVLVLKPDLILGSTSLKESYGLLSHIAPTVLINYSYSTWKEAFKLVALALGKTTIAEQWLSEYNNRISKFITSMGNRLAKTHISVLRGYITLIKGSFFGTILHDVGLTRPPSENWDITAYILSPEQLIEIDGDALFLILDTTIRPANAQKVLKQLQSEPLWSKLKAVRHGKVYVVGNYWVCCGPLAANQVLDDLSKYLLETPIPHFQFPEEMGGWGAVFTTSD